MTAQARHNMVEWIALGLVLFGALSRVLMTFEPLPFWDPSALSPNWTPPAGASPWQLVLLDALVVAGAAVLIGVRRARLSRWLLAALVLLGAGSVGVAVHGQARADHSILGMHWIAAMWAGVAMASLDPARAPWCVALAIGLGVFGLLAAKGVLQVTIEWPATLDAFRAERDRFLLDRGWAPDSDLARAYERRLAGGEATGWFGLSNVFATFAGAAAAAFGVLASHAWARGPADRFAERVRHAAPWLALCIASVGLLWLTGSKAGFAVLLATAALVVTLNTPLMRTPGLRAFAGWSACAALVGVLVLIAIRGFVGERVGELSVLFRWYYISTSVEIFGSRPWLGVGPDGFREAYSLMKPAVSPEDVISPHSVAFDWVATLGLAGLAWLTVLVIAARGVGGALVRPGDQAEAPAGAAVDQISWRGPALLLFSIAVPGLLFSRSMLTPAAALATLVGIGAGVLIIALLLSPRVGTRSASHAVAAAAAALLLHAQLDVAPVWPNSAAWWAMLIGLAAAPALHNRVGTEEETPARPRFAARAACAAPALLAAGWIAVSLLPSLHRWEGELRDAAGVARELADAESDLLEAQRPGVAPALASELTQRVLTRAAASLGRPSPSSPEEAQSALLDWRRASLETIAERFDRAIDARPAHIGTVRAAVGIDLAVHEMGPADGHPDGISRARSRAESLTDLRRQSTAAWALRSSIEERAAQAADGTDRASLLTAAFESRERAAAMDPHGLAGARAMVRLSLALNDRASAGGWARRVLEVDANLRLDPIRQLTPGQRAEYELIAAGGVTDG